MKTYLTRYLLTAFLAIMLSGNSIALILGTDWKVGDRVEAFNVSWYKVTILEIGTGVNEGNYLVSYDGFKKYSNNWIKAKNIRALREAVALPSTGPRLGTYLIRSYVGKSIYPQGDLELRSDNRYRVYHAGGKLLGEGKYEYSAKSASVVWLTGIYKTEKRGGAFTVSREGKGHHILLQPGTSAANEAR